MQGVQKMHSRERYDSFNLKPDDQHLEMVNDMQMKQQKKNQCDFNLIPSHASRMVHTQPQNYFPSTRKQTTSSDDSIKISDEDCQQVIQKLDDQIEKLDLFDEQDEYGNIKRGRKPPTFQEYLIQVDTKVDGLKAQVDQIKDNKQKKKLNNQISAYLTRRNRRKEFEDLRTQNKNLTRKLQKIVKVCHQKGYDTVYKEVVSIVLDKLDDFDKMQKDPQIH